MKMLKEAIHVCLLGCFIIGSEVGQVEQLEWRCTFRLFDMA